LHPNEITRQIVDAAYRIHRALGPGLLESVYEVVLARELESRHLHVTRQTPISISYENLRFDIGFKADLIVQNLVIVEIKSLETLCAVHKKQLLTYLRLSEKPVGLLINFNVVLIKDGILRIVNNLEES